MEIRKFFNNQLDQWPDARQRYDDLKKVRTRELLTDAGVTMRLQWNPARMVSTGAKIDRKTLGERPCFLCRKNRPKEQLTEVLKGKGGNYELLVNPFPILPQHFTIPLAAHEPQRISGHYGMMHQLTECFPELTVFYNGPLCGASAPDHMHLQAGTRGLLPLQQQWEQLKKSLTTLRTLADGATLSLMTGYVCPAFVIISRCRESDEQLFNALYQCLESTNDARHPAPDAQQSEPMMNILAWRNGEQLTTVILPRRKHRPDCYFAEGNGQRLVSPGALDMAGLIITPRQQDYEQLSAHQATDILRECAISNEDAHQIADAIKGNRLPQSEPEVSVGIVSAQQISFVLNGTYLINGKEATGHQQVEWKDGSIRWNGRNYEELRFSPTAMCSFTLEDVTIGVGFHWERQERQTFRGALRFVVDGEKACAINQLPVEQYLESVISSEMSATSSLELLKAHAVISRSWLLAQMESKKQGEKENGQKGKEISRQEIKEESGQGVKEAGEQTASGEHIRWYDHEDHTLFDVCADDHCQRYQGITRATNPHVAEAIKATRGQVLLSGNEICDTRFSKSCGGRTEEYQYCWENISKPYLKSVECPWCNTRDGRVIRQVLNDYDQETADFYEWTETVSGRQVGKWLRTKLGLEIGSVTDIIPLERGKSGRIWKMKLVGEKGDCIIGKELEIRRALSDSHLKSSWFDVEPGKQDDIGGESQTVFTLHGHGWGHGVGLCQIGAAVMGEKGMRYDEILYHYYQNARLWQIYE